MAQIVDLDVLVPEDVTFRFRGGDYTIPGDIDVEDTFRLLRLFNRSGELEDTVASLDEREQIEKEIRDALLDIFRQRDPDLAKLPFGVMALRHVLLEVLKAIGLEFVPAEGGADPPKPGPKKPRRSKPSPRS